MTSTKSNAYVSWPGHFVFLNYLKRFQWWLRGHMHASVRFPPVQRGKSFAIAKLEQKRSLHRTGLLVQTRETKSEPLTQGLKRMSETRRYWFHHESTQEILKLTLVSESTNFQVEGEEVRGGRPPQFLCRAFAKSLNGKTLYFPNRALLQAKTLCEVHGKHRKVWSPCGGEAKLWTKRKTRRKNVELKWPWEV